MNLSTPTTFRTSTKSKQCRQYYQLVQGMLQNLEYPSLDDSKPYDRAAPLPQTQSLYIKSLYVSPKLTTRDTEDCCSVHVYKQQLSLRLSGALVYERQHVQFKIKYQKILKLTNHKAVAYESYYMQFQPLSLLHILRI